MAIDGVATHPDAVYARAPGLLINQNVAPGVAAVMHNAWMTACKIYIAEQAGKLPTDLNEWKRIDTFTGTAQPATPANSARFAAECGTAGGVLQVGTGSNSYMKLTYVFLAKALKKEYRWVQERAYRPAEPNWYIMDRTNWEAPHNGGISYLGKTIDIDYYEAYMRGLAVLGGATIPGYGALPNYSGGGYWVYIYNYSGTKIFLGRLGVATYPEELGIWHLEERTVLDGRFDPGEAAFIKDWVNDDGSTGGASYAGRAPSFTEVSPSSCGQATYQQISRAAERERNRRRGKGNGRGSRGVGSGGGGPGDGTFPFTTSRTYGYGSASSECQASEIKLFADDSNDMFLDLLDGGDLVIAQGYTLEGEFHLASEFSVLFPGANYVIQEGSTFQSYSNDNLQGAFVYDLHLKKWGKWKWDYKVLVPLASANSGYNTGAFNYTDLGITAGLLRNDGLIYLFDQEPSEGFISYGKIGFYRLGMVHFLEAQLDFRKPFTGDVRIEASRDGRHITGTQFLEQSYTDVNCVKMYPNMRYRWYTITISGKYDLQYMEVRGNISSRR